MVMAAAVAAADDAEMNFSGEVKTGVFWRLIEETGRENTNEARLENNDDAGPGGTPGRIRLDGELLKDTIGFKMRWEVYDYRGTNIAPWWAYAYAYGDFIDEQLRLSGGRLGQSPWSTGGPELWDELDNRAGMRVEVKPRILEGLNVGFVLNTWNFEGGSSSRTLVGLIQESILGLSYTHEYFHIRAAYRFDSDEDMNLSTGTPLSEGHDFVYRVEERILNNYVEGLSIWANGRLLGMMAEQVERTQYINWLYIGYAPDFFPLDAQLRTGVDVFYEAWCFKIKPVVSYGITDFLRLGVTFLYEKEFGELALSKDAPYKTLAVEPLIRVTFTNMYVDLAYRFQRENRGIYSGMDIVRRTNWVNLRFVYTF